MKWLLNALFWLVAKIVGKCSKCTPLLLLCLLFGCTTQQRYIEGTMTQIGVFAPLDGQIYGANIVNYLNGVSV